MDTMAERVKRALELRGMTPADLIARKVLSKAGHFPPLFRPETLAAPRLPGGLLAACGAYS